MATNGFSPSEAKHQLLELMKGSSATMRVGLKRFVEAIDRRSGRLEVAQERLESALGTAHPRVKSLKRKLAAADEMKRELKAMVDLQDRQSETEPDCWIVHGRVLDAKGEPLADVKVSVADEDHQYDEQLGTMQTNEHGDFAVVYQGKDLQELLEKAPDLYLSITDADGNVLFSSRAPMRCELGKSEFFGVGLTEQAGTSNTKPRNAIVRKPVQKKTIRKGSRRKRTSKPEE